MKRNGTGRFNRIVFAALIVLLPVIVIVVGPAIASTPITSSNHIWINVANDAGVKFDMDSIYYGGLPTGNNTYYIKADGGGLNELHVTNANDTASERGQVTVSNAQSGVFYISNTGGRGFDNDIILLVSVKGPIPDDFAVRIRSSGYNWTPAPAGVYTPQPSTVDYYYVPVALNETFITTDFIYGPQTTRPGPSGFQPLYYGQNIADPSTQEYLMFVDLNAGNVYPSKFYDSVSGTYFNATHTGLPAPIDNGNVKVEYSFTNLTTHASFNGFGWCTAANQNEGINWANQGTGISASGYSVNGIPFAAFSSDVRFGSPPLTVRFTDASTGTAPFSYAWDFGDLSTSTDRDPAHEYTAAGTYTVSLTVTDAVGSDVETKTDYITVMDPPVADFTTDALTGTVPFRVNFTDTSTGEGITGYRWVLEDNPAAIFTERNLTHLFMAGGVYNVSHAAINAVGTSWKNETASITVLAAPAPNVTSIVPPKHKHDGKAFTAAVTGTGFWPGIPGTQVTLTKKGAKTIRATTVNIVSATSLACSFKIPKSAKTGAYKVTVINPDGQSGTPGAFRVAT